MVACVLPQIDIVVAGPVNEQLLSQYRRTAGVRRVLVCGHPSLTHLPADATASLLRYLADRENPSYICAAAGSTGKDVLPRLGGLMDVQPLTDIVQIKAGNTMHCWPAHPLVAPLSSSAGRKPVLCNELYLKR